MGFNSGFKGLMDLVSPAVSQTSVYANGLMKNPSDLIGNWTCILPACSAMPQPTVPPNTNACFNA